jgi:uncharacterized protein YegP (UPF0339 family)
MRHPFFEVFPGVTDSKWYFHLKGANGKVILQSEGYNSKRNAKQGAKTVRLRSAGSEPEIRVRGE